MLMFAVSMACMVSMGFGSCRTEKATTKPQNTKPQNGPVSAVKPDSISVRSVGAKGDGKTDDFAAIQRAFSSVKPGGVVFFPAGTYMMGDAAKIQINNLTIKGEGARSIIKFNNSQDLYVKYGKRAGVFNVMAVGISIKNLYFDQNFRESGRQDGGLAKSGCILVGGAAFGKPATVKNLLVENCTFYDYYGDALSAFNAYCSDVIYRKNVFISSYIAERWTVAGVHGEQAINFSSVNNALVENNDIQGALDDAIVVHSNSANVVFRNNTITTTGGRILMNGTSGGVIEGNVIRYIEGGACAIMVSYNFAGEKVVLNDGVVVKNNIITIENGVHISQAIRLNGAGNNIVVEGNVIEFKDTPSVGIEFGDRRSIKVGTFSAGEGITIKNNTIRRATVGIQETTVREAYRGVAIAGNKIEDTETGVNADPKSVQPNNYKNVSVPTRNVPIKERPKQPKAIKEEDDKD